MPTYSAIYAFGDSLSDAGNAYLASTAAGQPTPVSPPYFSEDYGGVDAAVFSNGPVWVQDVSLDLNLGTLEPALLGGNDYAIGGAQTGTTGDHPANPSDLPSQLFAFAGVQASIAATALVTVSIGGNDVITAATSGSTPQAAMADIAQAVTNEISAVNTLIKDGAKTLLILGVPDIGVIPAITDLNNSGLVSLATMLSTAYNMELFGSLAAIAQAESVTIGTVNLETIIDNAVNDPAAYGYFDVTDAAWTGNFTDANSGTLVSTSTNVQNGYLFWDHIHPTETGQQIIASEALQAISCFLPGTRIVTPDGERTVQSIGVGDRVFDTLADAPREVIWVGQRTIDCGRHPDPRAVWPVRIRAGALDHAVPSRDLWLSPDHALMLDGALIPVKYLIDGGAVAQIPVSRVTYHHVELESHGILLAEGAPAETFLDAGQRSTLNDGVVVPLYPDFSARAHDAVGCAPLVVAGPVLDGVRARLAERAAPPPRLAFG